MDPARAKIQADLRGVLQGDVRCDDLFVQMYATDASIYEIPPLGVIRPAGTHDVVATLKYCSEQGIPVHARGAGTCVAGESLGGGLVLDFSARMRRILRISEDSVDVQPGVVLAQLNHALRPLGRLFGPDPATRSVTTMGSVVAIDNSGSHLPLYGTASDHVIRVQAALADGQIVEFTAPPQPSANETVSADVRPQPDAAAATRAEELARRTGDLVDRYADVIERGVRPGMRVKTPGYRLAEVRENGGINLAKLMAGSEGTLALITEMTLAVVPRPAHRGVSLLFFDRLDKAAHGAIAIQDLSFAACDLMDRRILALARESDPRYASLIPRTAEAMLLVEQCGDDERDVRHALEEVAHRLVRKKGLAFASRSTLNNSERNLYWRLARRVVPTLSRLRGAARPLPFVEDVAVPPEQLPAMIVRVQNVLKTHAVTASMFCHAGHGVLHLRPFLSLSEANDVRRMERIATELYEAALDLGGIVGGEHGDGFSRTWFNRRQFGALYDVYRETKRIFDPGNLLNPGKISPEIASPLTKNLRRVTLALKSGAESGAGESVEAAFASGSDVAALKPAKQPIEARVGVADAGAAVELPVISLALNWKPEEALAAAGGCNGCGRCRANAADERMCPMFRALPREEAAPRSKANLFRAALAGSLAPADLSTDAMRAVADLCFNCHQCRLDCPAQVDVPGLAAEIRAQYVQANGTSPSDFFATRLHRVSSWGSSLAPLTNWAIQQPAMRWLIERVFGIAQGRKLPRFAPRPYHRIARRGSRVPATVRSSRKVIYFVDVYANWHDVQLGKALVAVLERNGVRVVVPPEPLVSGMAMYVAGATDAFKRHAAGNVAFLAKYVRQGYDIVTTEPSAALCLTHEYRRVLDDEDSLAVAEKTRDACAYLLEMHREGELDQNFRPVDRTIGYHLPCHVRALGDQAPALELLRMVPELDVRHIEQGCSGMAGTFGLRRKNFRTSLRIGRDLISAMRSTELEAGSTECSACKMQMEQGVSKPTIHPVKILAYAYGLAPDVERLFASQGENLVVT
ncbi:MAG TPA: anaerobic glycerol-3-phosphate dehydrogenase subunit C [Pirellulaceae bacterium]|jgi:FAD/FMN-containing dehydrogenase/Fe-S oxidoreductase|nr:anaerobic glycerol-3-phosphate dehydrogenase subunit C [Pirellulaceae bacterium]